MTTMTLFQNVKHTGMAIPYVFYVFPSNSWDLFATQNMYHKDHGLIGVKQGGHGTGKTGNLVITFSRQGKHREFSYNTGKIWTTQGIFQISLKNEVFYSKLPFYRLMYPSFFSSLSSLAIFPQTFVILMLTLHISVQFIVGHVKLNM